MSEQENGSRKEKKRDPKRAHSKDDQLLEERDEKNSPDGSDKRKDLISNSASKKSLANNPGSNDDSDLEELSSIQKSLHDEDDHSRDRQAAHSVDEKVEALICHEKLGDSHRRIRGNQEEWLNNPDSNSTNNANQDIENFSKQIFINQDPSDKCEDEDQHKQARTVFSNEENRRQRWDPQIRKPPIESHLRCEEVVANSKNDHTHKRASKDAGRLSKTKSQYQTVEPFDAPERKKVSDRSVQNMDNGEFNANFLAPFKTSQELNQNLQIHESQVLVSRSAEDLKAKLEASKVQINESKGQAQCLSVEYQALQEELKTRQNYLLQLREENFSFQIDIDFLKKQIEKVRQMNNQEETRFSQLSETRRRCEETLHTHIHNMKGTLDTVSQHLINNHALQHKVEMTNNFASKLQEIASFIESEAASAPVKKTSTQSKVDSELNVVRKYSHHQEHNFAKDKGGYSTPKPHNLSYNNADRNIASVVSSTYKLDDPFQSQSKKLDEILEMVKTMQKPKEGEIHTFRSKENLNEFESGMKKETNSVTELSNLESNKLVNQTFVLFNKMMMDFVKELPKFFASYKKTNLRVYEGLRNDYSRFSEGKIRRLNGQMLDLSQIKDAQPEIFVKKIIDFFGSEREQWKQFLQGLNSKLTA